MLDLDLGAAVSPKIQVVDIPPMDIYPPMHPDEKAGNYNCVIVDTVNELQNAEYLSYIDPSTNDLMTNKKYANLGVNLKLFVNQCKLYRDPSNNGQPIFILGHEGSGKSFGAKYLNPKTTLWIHTDSKPPTFKGASNWKPSFGNYKETTDYEVAKKALHFAYKNRNPKEPFVIFLMGHIDTIESKNSTEFKQQLKTVGNFAHKLNIEGAVSNCFKTVVTMDPETKKQVYCLDTENDGHNTVRCQEQLFPGRYIPNNLEYIRKQVIDWG